MGILPTVAKTIPVVLACTTVQIGTVSKKRSILSTTNLRPMKIAMWEAIGVLYLTGVILVAAWGVSSCSQRAHGWITSAKEFIEGNKHKVFPR